MTILAEYLSMFLGWLGRNSLQAAVLVGLILLVQWMLHDRLAPRWRYGLWMILLVRLVMPWAPSTSFSLYNVLAYLPSARVASIATPAPMATITDDSFGPAPRSLAVDAHAVCSTSDIVSPAETAISPLASRPAASTDRRLILAWPQIVALVWLGGALAVAMTILRQSLRLSGLGRHRLVTDQRVLDLLEDCKQQMGVSNYLAVVETEQVAGPALFGFVRPRLLLPQGLTHSLNGGQLRHVFLHELAHLKRRDVLVSWMVATLQALHWFNPLVWYGFARMRAERELACDALALSQQASPEPKEYGRTIVQLLESHITPRYQPSLAGVLEDKSQLTRRITMIARFRKSSQVWSVPAVVLLVLVGAVALTNAQTNQPAAATPSTAELVAAAREVVADMAKGDFARVTERFDATMKAALSAKQLQTAWEGVVQQAGPFQEITAVRTEQFGAYKIIYVTCRFQQGPVDVKVVFSTTGQIAGLFLQPTPIAANGSAFSQPSSITFSDQDLKVEPYKEGGLFQAVASVHNTGAESSGRWEVRFYRGEPKKGNEAGPGGAGGVGPIEPGKTFHEASLPFSLKEGQNVITAVLTPEGASDATAGLRAAVTVTIKDGKIVTQQPGAAAPTQGHLAGSPADDSLLNEGQRLYVEWTQKQFAEILNGSQYADLTPQTKAELETKWLAALNGQKNANYYQAINNLAGIKSRKAVPGLLRIAADRQDKNNRDRWMATRALGLIGETIAVPQLIPLTYHYNQNTRFWAQISLVRLTGANYGADWQAWANWWNGQGKQPQVSMTAVAWTTNAELADLARQQESDAKMVESLKGGGQSGAADRGEARGGGGGEVPAAAGAGGGRGGDPGASAAENPNRQALRTKYELRTRQDLRKYNREQLGEAEQLYQVANKNWRSPEAKESLQQMIAKYPDINRTGCAVLYMAQMSEGPQREQLLQQAIEKYGDCFYGDGVQVGAYARFYLAELYDESGQKDKAKVLCDEIRKDFPDAVNHSGVSLVQLINASHPKP